MLLKGNLTVVIVLLTWTVALGQQLCTSDSECPSGSRCDYATNNITDQSTAECSSLECIDCGIYNRKNNSECSTDLQECGDCLQNFIDAESSEDGQKAGCVLVSSTPEYMNVLLIFAIILPIAGLLVVAFSLCLGKFYHWRIVNKAKSAAQLMDEDYLNQEL